MLLRRFFDSIKKKLSLEEIWCWTWCLKRYPEGAELWNLLRGVSLEQVLHKSLRNYPEKLQNCKSIQRSFSWYFLQRSFRSFENWIISNSIWSFNCYSNCSKCYCIIFESRKKAIKYQIEFRKSLQLVRNIMQWSHRLLHKNQQ